MMAVEIDIVTGGKEATLLVEIMMVDVGVVGEMSQIIVTMGGIDIMTMGVADKEVDEVVAGDEDVVDMKGIGEIIEEVEAVADRWIIGEGLNDEA